METIKLRNGIEIPRVGIGTWQLTDRELLKQIVAKAYEEGYRLIDTAAAYSNEISLSKVIAEVGISRNELIITDKVWNTSRGYEAVQDACKRSLKKLKTDYIDLYLIHWPASMKMYADWKEINAETWRGMEALLKAGLVRAIGVCNFKTHHLEALSKAAEVMPLVNQIEYHPGMNQEDIYDYCVRNEIQIEAYSPLGNGQIMNNRLLRDIASRKGKTVAQICLRWEVQKNVVMIPRTSKIERLKENLDIFGFELTDDEMRLIDAIPYCGGLGIDPDGVLEFG